jgi:hypothetical protein
MACVGERDRSDTRSKPRLNAVPNRRADSAIESRARGSYRRFMQTKSLAWVALFGSIGWANPISLGESSAAVATHYVTVNWDGSFTPPALAIAEDDQVVFQGPLIELLSFPVRLPLRRTDAVVRVNLTDIDDATAANQPCMSSTLPYTIDSMLPGHDNELTGPLRRGASGIYALGPEEHEGFYEGLATETCDAIGAAAGSAAPLAGVEEWVETVAGGPNKLCRKHSIANGKVTSTNSPLLLESVWDNPSVTGAVVRINWRELYTITTVNNVEVITLDYTTLDTELANAAKRGKLVFLEILAGAGIPDWLFSDYANDVDASATPIVAKSVVPIYTSDFGSSSGTEMPTATNCGFEKRMGSPADPAYRTALLDTLRDLAEHVRASSMHYQALGSLKVTGLNFLTGEMRLPNRCLDPTATNPNGNPQDECWCNTRIWAAPFNTPVVANEGADEVRTVNGGGYTHTIAQNFMHLVEHTIYVALGRRKTMHFMLIQDGFPKVVDDTHYDTEAAPVLPNLGYVDSMGNPINFAQQTKDALDSGQLGNFAQVDADGNPIIIGTDPDAGALFSPMHASLGPIPASCNQALTTTLVNGKLLGVVVEPGVMSTNLNDYSDAGSGCPNKWAAREGYEGQIIGYQTKNDINTSDALSSTLWNATLNSNAVFVELYEVTLWRAEQERLAGNAVLSTSAAGYAEVPERQKSLAQWTQELHNRRRAISQFADHSDNRHMKDPFPFDYTFTFKKDLAANAVETYYFVNPAARCAAGTLAYGQIEVTGN